MARPLTPVRLTDTAAALQANPATIAALSGWSSAMPASGLGTTMTADSRAFQLDDVRLALSTAQTSHTHGVKHGLCSNADRSEHSEGGEGFHPGSSRHTVARRALHAQIADRRPGTGRWMQFLCGDVFLVADVGGPGRLPNSSRCSMGSWRRRRAAANDCRHQRRIGLTPTQRYDVRTVQRLLR
jgi:hypothetical protein